jgi:TP901 family phage tail tape measure protein
MAFNIAYTYQLIDKYTAPIQKIIAATRAHTRYLKENQIALRESNATLAKMVVNAGKTGTAMTRLANRSERLNGSLKALQHSNAFDHLTTQAKALNDQIDRMGRASLPGFPAGAVPGRHPGAVPGRSAPASKHVDRASRFGGAASALGGIGAGMAITNILKQTAAVENAMIDLGRATNLPKAELKAFEERFMTLSEKIGISTDKLAIMAFEGSKLGLPNEELDKFVNITAKAAVAFEVAEEEAGRALGSIKTKMGFSIGGLEEFMDRMNVVADKTSADGERMINIAERLSGTFNTLKLDPSVASGLIGVADQLERSPELAASGMDMVINKMMQSKALAAKMIADPVGTIRNVFTKLAKLPQAEKILTLTKMFGSHAAHFAVKLASNMQVFEDTMKIAASSGTLGSMQREMNSKLDSLTMHWNNLRNAANNAKTAFGEGMKEDIKKISDKIQEMVPKIREFTREHPGFVRIAAAVGIMTAAIVLAVPIAWALGAALAFIGAPILIAAAAIGLMAARWDEMEQAGHPVVTLIHSITRRVGHIIDKFKEFDTASDGSSKSIKILAKAFDWLTEFLALPLKMIDLLLAGLEKLMGYQDKIQPIGMLTDTESSLSKLIPPNIKAASNIHSLTGGNPGSASVNGTITVKAEPGTKATVSQPNLPTGSNLLMAK